MNPEKAVETRGLFATLTPVLVAVPPAVAQEADHGGLPSIRERAGDETLVEAKEACTFMIEGTVKWFNESKGFGFLTREGGPDVFVHHSEIRAEGYRSLNEGDRVRFEVVDSPKGPRAANVVKI